MRSIRVTGLLLALLVGGCAAAPRVEVSAPTEQVRTTELAFARSMADRDFDAFARFVAEDAVFLNGGEPLRGKAAILAHWQRFFESAQAPFAWAPDLVEVLPDGSLAHSEGPVTRPDGSANARFYSTWRLGSDGRWQVVFDNGHATCGGGSQ